MFFNSAEKDEENRLRKEKDEADKKAASKRRTDVLMESYYLEQKENELIAEAQEADYKINRKKMYTMPHYTRLQTQADTEVERVPGGWIFYKTTGSNNRTESSTFVPFVEEKIEMFYKLKNG